MNAHIAPGRIRAALLALLATLVLAVPSAAFAAATVASTSSTIRDVAFVDASVGYAVGSDGTILKTLDGGASWATSWSPGVSYDLTGVATAGSYVWAVSRDGALVISTNGGASWNVRFQDIGQVDDFYNTMLNDIDGVADGRVFAAGTALETNPPMLFGSTNFGSTFPFVNVLKGNEYVDDWDVLNGFGEFYGVDVVDSTHAWAAGHDDYLEGSTDHNDGVLWAYNTGAWREQLHVPGSGPLYDVSFGTSTWGIAVGAGGRIYTTTDGGTTWTPRTSGIAADIHSVVAGSMSHAWAVAEDGRILHSSNGGTSWSVVFNTGVPLHAVAVSGGTNVVAYGDVGVWARTTNGTTWTLQTGVPASQILSVSSPTHPVQTSWYSPRNITMAWKGYSAVQYSYVFDRLPSTLPDADPETEWATDPVTADLDGAWYFHVRSKNFSGEWGPAAHFKVQIDSAVPTLSHNGVPAYTTSANINFSAADTGGSGVKEIRYQLDGASEKTVVGSSANVSTTLLGAHTVTVRAYDNAGNASDAVTYEYAVYSPATVTTPTSTTHPSDTTWYSSRSAAFAWTGTSAVSYQYVFGTPSTPNWASPASTAATTANVSAAGDGEYWFHMRGVNAAGTPGAYASRKVRIDGTKPTIADDASGSYTSSASIHLSAFDTGGSGVKEIRYTLDSQPQVTVQAASATVTTSQLGTHTLNVTAYDIAGNVSDTEVIPFEVVAPGTPTVAKPTSTTHPDETAWYPSYAATLAWTGTSAAGYSYSIDDLPATTPDAVQDTAAMSASVSATGDGVWYFHVRPVNGVGVWGAPSHFRLQIDGTKPTLLHNAEVAYTSSASFQLTAADTGGSGVKEIRYTLDSDPEATESGTSASISVGVGAHTITARSYDNAGNPSDQLTYSFTVYAPASIDSVSSSSHPNIAAWYASRNVSMSWTGTSATGYSYSIDQAPTTTPDTTQDTGSAGASVSATSDGVWYFHVRGRNALGDWGSPSHFRLRIDSAKPTLTHNAASAYTSSASFTLSAADTGGSGVKEIRYTLDSNPQATVAGSSAIVSTSVLGGHTVTAKAYDNAGNVSDTKTIAFTVNAPYSAPTSLSISGANRYETAVRVSQQAFPSPATSQYVIIATGLNWPDALGGAALAKAYDAPILLVTKDTVPSAVANEITRLKATKAIILGGTASVSTKVDAALKARGVAVASRLGGANRYDTSRKVANAVAAKMGGAFPRKAFVATGANFADALAASPISAKLGWPIYLVGPSLTSADVNAMKAVGVTDVVILGGNGAVSGSVETGLKGAFPTRVSRLAGTSRYQTAIKVAMYGIGLNQGLAWDKLALAVGDNFPDALAGGVLQGRSGSVMLLTPGKTLDPGVKNVLVAYKAQIHQIRFLGGLLSITQTVRTAALSALK